MCKRCAHTGVRMFSLFLYVLLNSTVGSYMYDLKLSNLFISYLDRNSYEHNGMHTPYLKLTCSFENWTTLIYMYEKKMILKRKKMILKKKKNSKHGSHDISHLTIIRNNKKYTLNTMFFKCTRRINGRLLHLTNVLRGLVKKRNIKRTWYFPWGPVHDGFKYGGYTFIYAQHIYIRSEIHQHRLSSLDHTQYIFVTCTVFLPFSASKCAEGHR